MALTLGITGMDGKTEAELRAAFDIANAAGRWALGGDDADVIVVDMDSLYGPMSWLRLHAAGKRVIGLTAMERTQTDFRLARPIEPTALAGLLDGLSAGMPAPEPPVAAAASDPAPVVAAFADAPAPTQGTREASVEAPGEERDADAAETDAILAAEAAPEAATTGHDLADARDVPDQDRPLSDWIGPRGLSRRARLQRGNGPVLLLDVPAGQWHGQAALKPLAGYFDGSLSIDDFEAPSDAEWESETASLGAAQPLARLRWFGGLQAGKGAIADGHDPAGRFRLLKWPQTEREYPKHFRIATAMMKAPATVAEIADASGVAREEVADFVNANLATGYAEPAAMSAGEAPVPAPRGGGLLDRIRGR